MKVNVSLTAKQTSTVQTKTKTSSIGQDGRKYTKGTDWDMLQGSIKLCIGFYLLHHNNKIPHTYVQAVSVSVYENNSLIPFLPRMELNQKDSIVFSPWQETFYRCMKRPVERNKPTQAQIVVTGL